MAILPDYTTGTITLTSGSKDFTTSGSALQSKQVRSGDMIYSPVTGMFLLIDAITGENSGTLAYNCPAAAAVTDGPLRVRFQPDVSRYTAALYDVLDKLKSGNVDALAGLVGSAGKIPQFTGAGTMQLADYLVFNFRDDWATAIDYVVNDIVKQGGNTYICVVAHTSGTFATDLAAGKWDLFVPKGSDADIAADTHAATGKATPVDADELPIADSAASFGLKKLTWANVKATLKAYFDALYYRAGNIVGTVSQSSGVPTGAIIEKGSNANGRYVRFADGTQICTGLVTLVYVNANVLIAGWTFPAVFSAAPFICGCTDATTPQSSLRSGLVIGSPGTSSAQLRLGNGSGAVWATTDTAPCYMIATGTWF